MGSFGSSATIARSVPSDRQRGARPQIATFDLGVAVGPPAPVTTVNELVTWLKANPNQASYGTPAAGSLPYFFALLFAKAVGIEMRHVPYKANAPALADLIGGHLPIFFTSTPDLVEYQKAGRLRVLATSGAVRSPVLPRRADLS